MEELISSDYWSNLNQFGRKKPKIHHSDVSSQQLTHLSSTNKITLTHTVNSQGKQPK